MLIYPAIDLIDGRCVRLLHGDFAHVTQYGDPVEQIQAFADAGAEWVHIVDLDAARSGERRQTLLVSRLVQSAAIRVQCGGGVRTREDLLAVLDAGVERAVVGSAAARNPAEVRRWIDEVGAERVCCAFDVRGDERGGYRLAADGWTTDSGASLKDALAAFPNGGLRHVLITDIARDGALGGPNLDLLRVAGRMRPDLDIQASGGVSSLGDLCALRKAGAAGVIIGRALYEGKFKLEAALGR